MICLKEIPAEDGVEEYQSGLIMKYSKVENIVSGGNSTYDNVFILSLNEKKKYSKFFNSWKSLPTKHAMETVIDGFKLSIYSFGTENKNCKYWLRSPGKAKNYIMGVSWDGGPTREGGYPSNYFGNGVRPAIWIKYK